MGMTFKLLAVGVIAVGVGLAAAAPGVAQPPVEAGSAHPADPSAADARFPAARVQTLLARANFSPGLIDGKPGRKTKIAIEQYQRTRGLELTGALDEATLGALAETDPLAKSKAWTRAYTITEADIALITGPIPEDWNERAALERSGYADVEELLGERGWCAVELVRALNPSVEVNSLTAGDEVVLPDVRVAPLSKLSRVVINLTEKLIVEVISCSVVIWLYGLGHAKLTAWSFLENSFCRFLG